MIKLFISPHFDDPNQGNAGGICRVVEAQRKLLPQYGFELVDDVREADIVAIHAGAWVSSIRGDQKLVAHCHGLYWEEYEWQRWEHELNRQVLDVMKAADAITAPSNWVADVLRKGSLLNVNVIPHGVDVGEFVPGNELGYVLWNKTRIDPICEVAPMQLLANMCSDVNFISTLGQKTSNVEVTGVVDYTKAKGFIQHAGVYLCNTRETFGIGTLEALACGVPILGWNWGGQRDIVRHKKEGWLASPGDYDDLKAGLYWCLEHRLELATRCRHRALEYSWDKVMLLYAMLFNALLARAGSSEIKSSVIITSYNLKQYLPDAINSVLPQLGDEHELIIVDDCSTDGSFEIAKTFESEGCRVLRTPSNQYLAGALNFGIEAARGEYVIPLDADNMLAPGALQTLSEALNNDRRLDIAYGAMKVIEEQGHEFVSGWPPERADVKAQLQHRNQCPSTSMYRRALWKRIGGYRKRCRTGEDADFWCRALANGALARKVTDAPTLIYRDRPDSMSHVETDWPWEAWYPHHSFLAEALLTPANGKIERLDVPSYEPVHVSVIIPVGPGHEEIYVDAIDSVLAQDYKKWELIIINDSGHELKWLPEFVRYTETPEPGSGPSIARNLGLVMAKGRYFVPLDADDYLEPTALGKLASAITRYTGYVYCDFFKIQQDDEGKTFISTVATPEKACDIVSQMLPHPITGIYPLAAWKETGFDDSLRAGEDWDFVSAVTAAGYCGSRYPEPLVYYRTTSGTRRTALLDDKPLQNKIRTKWHREGIVACGCNKGGNAVIAAQTYENAVRAAQQGDMHAIEEAELVAVEYVMPNMAPMVFRGRGTGQQYRFGSDDGHRIKYVHRADAEFFLNREEFRLVENAPVAV